MKHIDEKREGFIYEKVEVSEIASIMFRYPLWFTKIFAASIQAQAKSLELFSLGKFPCRV